MAALAAAGDTLVVEPQDLQPRRVNILLKRLPEALTAFASRRSATFTLGPIWGDLAWNGRYAWPSHFTPTW